MRCVILYPEFVFEFPAHQVDHLLAVVTGGGPPLIECTQDLAPFTAAVQSIDLLSIWLVRYSVPAAYTFDNHGGRHQDPNFGFPALLVLPEHGELVDRLPVDLGGLLIDERKRGRPRDIGETGQYPVDGLVAVSLDNLVAVVPRECLAQVRVQSRGTGGIEFSEAKPGERRLGFHGDDGRSIELGAGVPFDVLGLAGHEVEVDTFWRPATDRCRERRQVAGEDLQLVAGPVGPLANLRADRGLHRLTECCVSITVGLGSDETRTGVPCVDLRVFGEHFVAVGELVIPHVRVIRRRFQTAAIGPLLPYVN